MPTSPSSVSSASWRPSSSSDSPEQDHQLESRMREIRPSGSEGGGGLRVSPYPYPVGGGKRRGFGTAQPCPTLSAFQPSLSKAPSTSHAVRSAASGSSVR